MTEHRLLRSFLYAGSTLCGLSRINDDAHYPSQSAAGWWLAYLACRSVSETEARRAGLQLMPVGPSRKYRLALAVGFVF
jgi:membrane-associated phospholipid phosphatase